MATQTRRKNEEETTDDTGRKHDSQGRFVSEDEEQGGEGGAHGSPFLRGHPFTPGTDSTSGDVGGRPRRRPTRRIVPGFTRGPPLVIVTRTGTPWNPPCSRCPTPSPASVFS